MDAACIRLFARCFAPRMATEPDRLAKATRAESVLRCRHRKPLTTRARRKGAAACVDNDPLVKRLRIAAFGGFTIFAGNDDRTAAFSARLRRCIAHLVLHGDAVDRRSLAFELWPDVPEARAVANLRRRLHELSAAFASIGCPKALERSPAGVRLAAFIREGCDVRDYLHKKNDPASAARAAAIYAQPIFAGVDDEWLDSARERMRAEHVELLCTLLDRSIAAKDPIAIVEHAEGVARYDPSSEAAIAEAVRTLRDLGEPDRARRLFERFEAHLRSQVDADPIPIESRQPPGLPLESTPFFERGRELRAVASALERARVVTLVGPPGVGKSRVAWRAAAQLASTFPGGARYLDLSAYGDEPSARAALATLLRARTATASAIAEAVSMPPSLLLLDNADGLIADFEPLIAALVAADRRTAIILTSRVPLRSEGEAVVRIEPFERSNAVSFFLSRAELAGAQFERTHEHLTAASAICRELDGVPLALELAARRLPATGFVNLYKALDNRFTMLGKSGGSGRHDTLAGALDWSYNLLAERERHLFRIAGLLRSPWTAETSATLAGVTERSAVETIARLVDASLLDLGPSDGTFSSLRTTREYMRLRLAESGELERFELRYVEVILAPYVLRNDELRGARGSDAFNAIEASMDDIRCAFDRAIVGRRDVELGAHALAALSRFLFDRGYAVETRRWCEAAVAALDAASPLRAEMLYVRALMARNAGSFNEALNAFEEAIEALKLGEDSLTLAKAMLYASNAARMTGRGDRARTLADEAYAIVANGGDAYLAAFARSAVGTAAYALGDLDGAKGEFEMAARAFAALDARDDEALMLVNAARCDFGRGDLFSPEAAFEGGLTRALDAGNVYVEAHARVSLGLLALDRGQATDANEHLTRAAAIAFKTGDIELSAIALEACAELCAANGERERAVVAAVTADGVRSQYALVRAPTERARYERLRESVSGLLPSRSAASAGAAAAMRSILGRFSGGLAELKTARRR